MQNVGTLRKPCRMDWTVRVVDDDDDVDSAAAFAVVGRPKMVVAVSAKPTEDDACKKYLRCDDGCLLLLSLAFLSDASTDRADAMTPLSEWACKGRQVVLRDNVFRENAAKGTAQSAKRIQWDSTVFMMLLFLPLDKQHKVCAGIDRGSSSTHRLKK